MEKSFNDLSEKLINSLKSGEHLKITAPVPEGDKVWRYFSKLDAHK